MKLISKLPGGGYHPASGLDIAPDGEVFEVDDRPTHQGGQDPATQMITANLAAKAPADAVVTWPPPPAPEEPVTARAETHVTKAAPQESGDQPKKSRGERREE